MWKKYADASTQVFGMIAKSRIQLLGMIVTKLVHNLRRLNGTVTRRQRDLFFVQPSRAIFVAGPGDQISRPAFHQRTSLP